MVATINLKFLHSFLYSEHINLIQDFGFLPLPYVSLAQTPFNVTHATFVLGLQHTYKGEHAAFGLLSLAKFTEDDILQFHPFTCK
jgi:hypothetical protein